jgi:hypothetical protein
MAVATMLVSMSAAVVTDATAQPTGLVAGETGFATLADGGVLYEPARRSEVRRVTGAAASRRVLARPSGVTPRGVEAIEADGSLAAVARRHERAGGSERGVDAVWAGPPTALRLLSSADPGCETSQRWIDVDRGRVARIEAGACGGAASPPRIVITEGAAPPVALVPEMDAVTTTVEAVRLAGDHVAWVERITGGNAVVVQSLSTGARHRIDLGARVDGYDPQSGDGSLSRFDLRPDGAVVMTADHAPTATKGTGLLLYPGDGSPPRVLVARGVLADTELASRTDRAVRVDGTRVAYLATEPAKGLRLATIRVASIDADGSTRDLTPRLGVSTQGDIPTPDGGGITSFDVAGTAVTWTTAGCLYLDPAVAAAAAPRPGPCLPFDVEADASYATPRRGLYPVKVACRLTPVDRCRGSAAVQVVRGGRRATLASGTFGVAALRRAIVRLPLTAFGRRFFASARARRPYENDVGELAGRSVLHLRDTRGRLRTIVASAVFEEGEYDSDTGDK